MSLANSRPSVDFSHRERQHYVCDAELRPEYTRLSWQTLQLSLTGQGYTVCRCQADSRGLGGGEGGGKGRAGALAEGKHAHTAGVREITEA